MNALNQRLYDALADACGDVLVANAGEAFRPHYERDAMTGEVRLRLDLSDRGEAYRVNCPFCGDGRQRLYVNHRWAVYDETTGRRHLELCRCFNETECLRDWERRRELYQAVYEARELPRGVTKGRRVYEEPGVVVWPPNVTAVDQLPPDHPAVRYVVGRRFDPGELAEYHGVGFCGPQPTNRFIHLEDRILIPVRAGGKAVGWQARALPEDEGKVGMKYLNMHGFKKAQHLYNLDNARRFPVAVLVEGPTDVWRVGPEAVATFGKHLSQSQAALLRGFSDIRVMYDADAQRHTEAAVALLQRIGVNARAASLPDGSDPADLSSEAVRAIAEL